MSTRRDQVASIVVAMAVAGSGASLTMTGCEGLDYSASAEGTGIQVVGAIVVLAKYHASSHQKAIAAEQGRKVFIQAAKPHYERRRAAAQTGTRKKIADIEGGYGKRIAQAQRGKPATGSPEPGASPVAQLEAEKKSALDKLQADAAAELASLDREWHSLAGTPTRGLKMQNPSSGSGGGVPLASTRDREALVASATAHMPKYIAVAVPPQGIASEQGGRITIMLWDTRRQRLAGDEVLVLDRTLRDGVDVKVDGVTARFASSK